MGVIGNTIGEVRYVDLPITAGVAPSVTFTTDRVLDLLGIEVLAPGATAAALKVNAGTVAGGAIAAFANSVGAVHAAAPTPSVPTGATGGGAQQGNSTTAGNVNWQSSGTVQPVASTLTTALTIAPTTTLVVSATPVALNIGDKVVIGGTDVAVLATANKPAGSTSLTVTSFTPTVAWPIGTNVYLKPSALTDRNGSVPAPGAVTPISAAIASGIVVEVDLTGTVTTVANLPAADGNGFITLLNGNSQSGFTNLPVDGIPFKVKATDTLADTFAGIVRLIFQVPVSDPNSAAKAAGTYPNNGIQKGSGGIY